MGVILLFFLLRETQKSSWKISIFEVLKVTWTKQAVVNQGRWKSEFQAFADFLFMIIWRFLYRSKKLD